MTNHRVRMDNTKYIPPGIILNIREANSVQIIYYNNLFQVPRFRIHIIELNIYLLFIDNCSFVSNDKPTCDYTNILQYRIRTHWKIFNIYRGHTTRILFSVYY